ncbi:MAG: glycoside hydrolase [Cytophagales bacterium]|nr:glycoside hydrolase [Cytophagales bacterium]
MPIRTLHNNPGFQFPVIFIILLVALSCDPKPALTPATVWPEITKEHKPWTRWWWMGSAVSKKGIEDELNAFANAGFGGVEITPIYGVKGYESHYIDFLSDEWMEMLRFTMEKAEELDLGVDMNLGTGWPFGGPRITPEFAASRLLTESYDLNKGEKLRMPIESKDPRQNPKHVKLLALMAYFEDGTALDVKPFLDENNRLNWVAAQNCEVVAAFNGKTGQRVKRAAPGGSGWTMDHFSREALNIYLAGFDSAFKKIEKRPRAFYNDSYEVYGSSGTEDIFEEFRNRRGYDLRLYLSALRSTEDSGTAGRIQSDYRETFAELLMEEFTRPWVMWANNQDVLTRNQAHGSPANIIDLYTTVDIPECETFGSSYFPIPGLRRDSTDIRPEDPDPVMLKFATSAANIYGKKQVSSETFTWLSEHFKTSLSQCKPELEQVFLAGVNHVFYHGTTYSPNEADWPGWLFYASVQFGRANSFWPHINGLNKYIARCQSILQAGRADNDVLIYWPYYDTRHGVGRLDRQITVHNLDEWLHPTAFYKLSKDLMKHGYLVDFATDRMVSQLKLKDGSLQVNDHGGRYSCIIVPTCKLMPLATLRQFLKLADEGATVIFQDWPEDVPGFYELEKRRSEHRKLMASIEPGTYLEKAKIAKMGHGHLIISKDVTSILKSRKIPGEQLTETGLQFVRRKINGERYYFLVNHTSNRVDEKISLNVLADKAVMMDPDFGTFGKISLNKSGEKSEIRIQLDPGQSMMIRCTDARATQIRDWQYVPPEGRYVPFDHSWKLSFASGGPELPDETRLDRLKSWTELPDEKAGHFSGLGIYENEFTLPEALAAEYILDLGKVAESARVRINDREVNVLWGIPFKARIGKFVKKGKNSIRVEVANLMANRIRYMDRQGMEWRKFHEINFVNIDYKPFDASGWEQMPSGLLGPITLYGADCE